MPYKTSSLRFCVLRSPVLSKSVFYSRVSIVEAQSQRCVLKDAGCEVPLAERASGSGSLQEIAAINSPRYILGLLRSWAPSVLVYFFQVACLLWFEYDSSLQIHTEA